MENNTITIQTPAGRLEAKASPNPDYPGISVTLFDKDGYEKSSIIFEFTPTEQGYPDGTAMLRVWGPDDPDGCDPSILVEMAGREAQAQCIS